MDSITVHYGAHGPPVTVRETDPPGTWELEYPDSTPGISRRILKAAEHAILQLGGERLAINCPKDNHDLLHAIQRWPAAAVTRAGDHYTIALIKPGKDGLVHDDFDSWAPLARITCLTCVERVAESRTRARREAYQTKATPPQISVLSHLVAEAYIRLAEIEESLNVPPPDFADKAA